MKIICAGLPKTGTKSIAAALRYLGYTVYDTIEHSQYHMDEWTRAMQGRGSTDDFQAMYADVDAATDAPPCHFFDDIYKAFPNAKVLLCVRDSKEDWEKSLRETVDVWNSCYGKSWLRVARFLTPTGRKWCRYQHVAMPFWQMNYTEHNQRVRDLIPAKQLLVFNVKQGWEPLCTFLGHAVPEIPFPRVNVKSSTIPSLIDSSPMVKQMWNELIFIVTLIVLSLAWLYYVISK